MSFEAKKDEMVGKYVALFQAELTMAKCMEKLVAPQAMPYGYPVKVYHPYHSVLLPRHTRLLKHLHEHGRMSNDVPWLLGMELVNDNPIGLYNPKQETPDEL